MVNHIPQVKPVYGDAPDQDLFQAACIQAEIRSSDELSALTGDDHEETLATAPVSDENASQSLSEPPTETETSETAPQDATQDR